MKERTFWFLTKHAGGGDKGILCLWEGRSRGEGVHGEMREQSTLLITTIWILPVSAHGEHQNQQNLCNEEMRNSSFQEEIRKNSVTLVWGKAEKPFPLLRPQIADVVDSQPRTCAASSWGCVCVWKALMSTARAAGTCRLLTMPCPEVKLTTKASETTGYGMRNCPTWQETAWEVEKSYRHHREEWLDFSGV